MRIRQISGHVIQRYCPIALGQIQNNMAARNSNFTVEEVAEKLIFTTSSLLSAINGEDVEARIRSHLSSLFEGHNNSQVFLENAVKMLVPLYVHSRDLAHKMPSEVLSSPTTNATAVLRRESRLWLASIRRR